MKCRLVEINESKAIHLHFYAKLNRWSRKLSGGPKTQQIAPFISNFSGGACAPDPPTLF